MGEEMLALERRRSQTATVTLQDVFEASYRRLVVQLYAATGDRMEAEDLVQDAFVRAAAAGNRFLKVENHEAWLRTTAVNLYRSRWRKARNFSRIKHRLAAPEDLPGLEDHLALMEALSELPEQQRLVLVLHHLADLPIAEIAGMLGCAEGTVKSRLARAREALATSLGPRGGEL